MKRPRSSDSAVGPGDRRLMAPAVPTTHEDNSLFDGMGGSFKSLIEGLGDEVDDEMAGDEDLCSRGSEKKRRLSIEQVRALEKSFETENKLEPERKARLAQELGLQPRQVAVWFQNRRARWKTKQLERDYGTLKASHDALAQSFEALRREKDVLAAELKELKAKLAGEGGESSFSSVKTEPGRAPEEDQPAAAAAADLHVLPKDEAAQEQDAAGCCDPTAPTMDPSPANKDSGLSDSDSSAVLNGDNSPRCLDGSTTISSGISLSYYHHRPLQEEDHNNRYQQQSMFMGSGAAACDPSSASSSSPFQCPDGRSSAGRFESYFYPQQQFVAEEQGFFAPEVPPAAGPFFSDDQTAAIPWYYSHQWS